MYTRDDCKPAGSEARGAGREEGNLMDAAPKPHVAQGAGGCYLYLGPHKRQFEQSDHLGR